MVSLPAQVGALVWRMFHANHKANEVISLIGPMIAYLTDDITEIGCVFEQVIAGAGLWFVLQSPSRRCNRYWRYVWLISVGYVWSHTS